MTKERFAALWKRCLDDGVEADGGEVFDALVRRYGEPQRHYHTLRHIEHCLARFDLAASETTHPDAIEMALWFHDAIYDPQGPDNELRSAEWFLELARGRLDPAFSRHVYDLIMATTHRAPPHGSDACFVVDVDLSSLGLSWEEFDRDSQAIRAEQRDVPDGEFYRGQLGFLRALLSRPSVYATAFFRERFEASARENIRRRLKEISRAGFG